MLIMTRDHDELSLAPDGLPLSEQPQWRQDFPIDVAQDNYVSRREFAKFLVLISSAFSAGQFWILFKNWQRNQQPAPPAQKIASLAEIPVGGTLVFHYPNEHEPCILVRPNADTLLAYSQKCTHLSCAVIPNVAENQIGCPCHNGSFSLAEGRPLAGPPQRPLPRIHVEVRGDEIFATAVELRSI
ncbi:ubiquinol-cytochrome c reductase iron-sulfur subunit [Herpetosiphon llansteffanensis]|uniref:QcrA and Rieske domain-containing protein n=1 Tax=Herpetosiphon llansteffanensis TaxID=2094568 RepID=UPI001F0CD64D|nr:ubiquinol-cytochrome c reductase iron-sulfur subunit [Herpetosiphon llansteffanensis]